MVEKNDFSLSLFVSSDKLADHLEALAHALRSGKIEMSSGEQKLLLIPEGDLDCFIEAYSRGTRNKVSFDMTWSNRPKAMTNLEITSKKPQE